MKEHVTAYVQMGKRSLRFGTLLLSALFVAGNMYAAKPKQAKAPVFTKFVYQGNDQVYNDNPLNEGEFYNPILQGCYPDPAIVKGVKTTSWLLHLFNVPGSTHLSL